MTVLAKNVLDSSISIIVFWIYCELFQPNLVIGETGGICSHLVLFHSAFCANAVTICSGAMAERTHMTAYLFFAVLMSFVIYPELAISAWSNQGMFGAEYKDKFHTGYKYHDFAGSGVVHLVGGCSALVGNMLLGRRIMREESDPQWDQETPNDLLSDDGVNGHMHAPWQPSSEGERGSDGYRPEMKSKWPRRFDCKERDNREFQGANYLQAMGMFTLWVGW